MFRNELPLVDFMQMMGNFTPDYYSTAFNTAGYFDGWNIDTSNISSNSQLLGMVEDTRQSLRESTGDVITYDLLFRPPTGILNSSKPLMPKKEFILSFDRAPADLALIDKKAANDSGVTDLTGKVLPLKNIFLKARYYSTPFLRNYFDANNEITYKYDELSVYCKNLPTGETVIRMPNIIGGNTPKYLFAGIIEASALNGDFKKSSTAFKRHGVLEFDLTLNGYSCHGFPLSSQNKSPVQIYDKFLRTTKRTFQSSCPKQLEASDFKKFFYIYAHKFEGENSESGWVGVNLKLEAEYADNYVLGNFLILNSKKNFF